MRKTLIMPPRKRRKNISVNRPSKKGVERQIKSPLKKWPSNDFPKVWFFVPYSFDKNLGKAYNEYMELIPDNDWGCIMDGDIMFLMPDWGHQIQQAVIDNPDAGIITCITNRISNKKQRLDEPSTDILIHKRKAQERYKARKCRYSECNRNISGFLMCIKKSVWQRIKFPEIGSLLNVDNIFSREILRNHKKIIIMEGMYVFHYYRLLEGKQDKSHLL